MIRQRVISRHCGIHIAVNLNLVKECLLTVHIIDHLFDVADFIHFVSGFHRHLIRVQIQSWAFCRQFFDFRLCVGLVFRTCRILLLRFLRCRCRLICCVTVIRFRGRFLRHRTVILFQDRFIFRQSIFHCSFIIHTTCYFGYIVMTVLGRINN